MKELFLNTVSQTLHKDEACALCDSANPQKINTVVKVYEVIRSSVDDGLRAIKSVYSEEERTVTLDEMKDPLKKLMCSAVEQFVNMKQCKRCFKDE